MYAEITLEISNMHQTELTFKIMMQIKISNQHYEIINLLFSNQTETKTILISSEIKIQGNKTYFPLKSIILKKIKYNIKKTLARIPLIPSKLTLHCDFMTT